MHYFLGFKNFVYAELNLFSNFTLLIGKNGAGKSNLIEGVELLAALAEGRPLHELVEGRGYSPGSNALRGGIHSCLKFGYSEFTLGFSGVIKFLGKNESFDYSISVSIDPFPRVSAESLIVGKRKIFFATTEKDRRDGILDVQYDNFARGGQKPHRSIYGDRSLISRYEEVIEGNESGDQEKKLKSVHMVATLKKHLQSSFVFDPSPKLMREYVRSGQNTLLKDGSNISAVLQGLKERPDGDAALENILKVVRQIPEEPFLEFNFIKTLQNDVLFGIQSGGRVIDARLISDGTLRIIAVVTALETIASGSRVVIEEFDNGLHPSRAAILIGAIKEVVIRRRLNVLLTTHNPATLDSLDKDWLAHVYICYWSPPDDTSILVNLLEIPKVDSLLESNSSLGDLVSRSVFEKHLQPKFEDSRKSKALEWLERLK
ncbi:TPA: ATP-binding protein [Pseudomonas aeruginosa]|nr:ATP-binding protein [Pseudomonas aeruginosa]